MTEPTDALLPCPFCGSKAAASMIKSESLWTHDVVDWTRVHCTNNDCNAQTESICDGYEPSAVEVWNHRTPPTAQAADPVAWRVHPFDHCIGHEGVYAMTMREDQREAWKRKGWNTEPLFTAPQPVSREPLEPCMDNVEGINARLHFRRGWKAAEQAHGIKGGQHG